MTDTAPAMTRAEFVAWNPQGDNNGAFTEMALELGWLVPRTSYWLEGTAIELADISPTGRYFWGWYGPAKGPGCNAFPVTPSGSWSEMFP